MKKDKDTLKSQQVFTPAPVTNMMLNLLDQRLLADDETFFFEPSCGDGQMLVVILDRIYQLKLDKYQQDREKALADTLFKFYAIELDPELVVSARHRIFKWIESVAEKPLSTLESYLIARCLQRNIECRDFFEFMGVSKNDNRI